jgi:AMP phosphorylase
MELNENGDIRALPGIFDVIPIDLETGEYTVVLNRVDANAMGLRSLDRVRVTNGDLSITAIVELTDTVVAPSSSGLLLRGREHLKVKGGDRVRITPVQKPQSIEIIKKRLNRKELTTEEINRLTDEISNHALSDAELAAFVTSTYMQPLTKREIKDLTLAMVNTGISLELDVEPVFDFHSIGGVPGNKVTLLVVPIIAAAGLYIPKTCSRAISSAGGTADILETICNVTLSANRIKEITEKIGGVIAWGGGVNIAPADDIIIRVEYPLSIDPYSQVIASVLAKKKAVGADYLLLDIPTGANTKVEDMDLARRYARDFMEIGEAIGIKVECAITYGGQPVGRNIGPALEVQEALKILEGDPPSTSTIEKGTALAGMVLEMAGITNDGKRMAEDILRSGAAMEKFREIVKAQGAYIDDIASENITIGKYCAPFVCTTKGYVASINNRDLVKIARAAGCPHDKLAGIVLEKKKGHQVDKGDVLLNIYSDSEQRLKLAMNLAKKLSPFSIEGMILEVVPVEKILS